MELARKRAGGIAYREGQPSEPSERLPFLCLHGWPQSSYMWRHLLPAHEFPPAEFASRFAKRILGSKLVMALSGRGYLSV